MMITVVLAYVWDQLISDPKTSLHPVALMGRLIAFLESIFYRKDLSPRRQMILGGVVVALTLAICYDLANVLLWLLGYVHNMYLYYGIESLVLSLMICPKSLAAAGQEIRHYLMHHHLDMARLKVSWIVGRDTDTLDEGEVTRATVETIAENTVDGIISPLFWFALGGLPLAVVYRAANTLDSMIAYKNDKYLYFGRVAARLDDVLNWIPARIGAVFFVLTACILRYDWKNAISIIRRDAAKHPSPNGGYAEAAVAGALGIRLGGYNSYFGKMTFRAYMGDAVKPLQPYHIRQAIYLMYGASLWTMAAVMLWLWWV